VLGPQEVKVLAMGYVDEAVTSAKIPTIKGSKEWGTYQIHGIKIKKIHITEDTLDVAITKVVTIVRSATPLTERCPTARETASDGVCLQTVSHVSADFDEFGFNYAKTTFPKMDDSGTATAQLVDLSATISFEIVVDDSGALTVDNVKANIKIGALDVQVRRR